MLLLSACARNPVPPNEASIRQALTASTGVVRLPAGTFEISSELTLPEGARDLEIAGAGPSTILRASASFQGRALLHIPRGVRIRLHDFALDGNRSQIEKPTPLPPSDVPFARFTRNNGLLLEQSESVDIRAIQFREIAGFAILASASKSIHVESVTLERCGSRNAAGRNNGTGGILFEEGATDFQVVNSDLRHILGNGIWTHSLYTSPRNARGEFARNHIAWIGRDALQAGHATDMRIEANTGTHIGFPPEAIDMEARAIPVAIDTAGNVDRSVYAHNRFEEINGKCIDLDGFHHGEVRANTCVNRRPPEEYPIGGYGIVMNNTNPDMRPEHVVIAGNVIDGPQFGGIFVIGSHNTITGNKLRNLNRAHCNEEAAKFGCYYAPDEPAMLRSGIYLGRGAERPAPAKNNRIAGNEISGFKMAERCIAAAPGVSLAANQIEHNRCR